VLKNLLVAASLVLMSQLAAAETWRVASLEWPPFTGGSLPEGGAGIAVLRAALKVEGIELQVDYFPWARAVLNSRNAIYAGLYPAWPEDVPAGFTPSVTIFKSPVGLVEPAAKPIPWNRLNDLSGYSIGTVQGYGNTPEFMSLIRSGKIKTQIVDSDLTNVKKVAAGRIDAAFIDLTNLAYLLEHDARGIAHKVQANKKPIDNKLLLLAINNKFYNPRASEILNRGVSKINPNKIIQDYLKKYSIAQYEAPQSER
jgi:polar amino acid transport system substrate-binding protein